jgi:hypothetical protein
VQRAILALFGRDVHPFTHCSPHTQSSDVCDGPLLTSPSVVLGVSHPSVPKLPFSLSHIPMLENKHSQCAHLLHVSRGLRRFKVCDCGRRRTVALYLLPWQSNYLHTTTLQVVVNGTVCNSLFLFCFSARRGACFFWSRRMSHHRNRRHLGVGRS